MPGPGEGTALNVAETGMLGRGGPIPLIGLLTSLGRWIEQRHLELLAAAGFPEIRRAHTPVVVNLPAGGARLTDLAEAAGISKQAMADLVDDLVDKGYLHRQPDPTDGRAKLLVMTARAEAAHVATLRIFADIEDELAEVVGREALESVRDTLTTLVRSVVSDGPSRSRTGDAEVRSTTGES